MRLYLLIVVMMASLNGAAQTKWGELKGVVAYVPDDGRVRVDAGALVIVYFIDSVKSPDNKYEDQHAEDSIVNNAMKAAAYYEEYEETPIRRTRKQMLRKLKDLDAYPRDKLWHLESMAGIIIKDRERRQYSITAADRNGRYLLRLRPGYYGIIFRSFHLRSQSGVASTGNIVLVNVEIKAGQSVRLDEEIL